MNSMIDDKYRYYENKKEHGSFTKKILKAYSLFHAQYSNIYFNPNKPGLNFTQERLGQGYHNPALQSLYPRFLSC